MDLKSEDSIERKEFVICDDDDASQEIEFHSEREERDSLDSSEQNDNLDLDMIFKD